MAKRTKKPTHAPRSEGPRTRFEEWAKLSRRHSGAATAYRALATVFPPGVDPAEILAAEPSRTVEKLVRKKGIAPRSARWYLARLKRGYTAFASLVGAPTRPVREVLEPFAGGTGTSVGPTLPAEAHSVPPPPPPTFIPPPSFRLSEVQAGPEMTIRGHMTLQDVAEVLAKGDWVLKECTFSKAKTV